ncbi:MAG: septation protein SepH, partial [Naasia sp.]
MHTLRGVAIEGGAIIATDQNGTSFRVEVDDTLRSRLRESATAPLAPRKLSPREIQTQIRAGMSADEVAKVTGAPLDYIQRYEGPVLAERQYVVESALGVPVRPLVDDEPDAIVPTFGGVMGERLLQLSARGTHWSSWKEEAGGWVLKLSFAADSIDHDARWRFDPKKLILSPLNAEAVALSQQGEIGASLLPRLRAVPQSPDSSRFDSGAFEPLDRPAP